MEIFEESVEKEDIPFKWHDTTIASYEKCIMPHWHNRIEMICVVEGSMKAIVGEQTALLKRGDIMVVNTRCVHQADACENGVKYFVLLFKITELLHIFPEEREIFTKLTTCENGFEFIFRDDMIFQKTLTLKSPGSEKSLMEKTNNLIIAFEVISMLFSKHIIENKNSFQIDNKIAEILSYIDSNFTEDIKTAELAKKLSYDEAYFCRKFHNITGVTPTKYIKMLRMEYAKKLLLEGERNIRNLAINCGFSDQNYFTRTFKGYYGVSPKAWISNNL